MTIALVIKNKNMSDTKLSYELLCRYPNARVMYNGISYNPYIICKEHRTIQIHVKEEWDTFFHSENVAISDCQLILRTMEDMTDEEMKSEKLSDTDTFKEWKDEIFTGNFANYADYVDGNTFMKLLDYLRSINISTESADTENTWWVRESIVNDKNEKP